MPTENKIVQNWCLQFIGFVRHYFTPVSGHITGMKRATGAFAGAEDAYASNN